MNRDFAYKGQVGKGAVNTKKIRKNHILQFSIQLLMVILAFIAVFFLFDFLSSGKRQPTDQPETVDRIINKQLDNNSDGNEEDNDASNNTTEQKVEKNIKSVDIPKLSNKTIDEDNTDKSNAIEPDTLRQIQQTIEEQSGDELEFYKILDKPLIDNYSPDTLPQEKITYKVESGLIRNKVNARSLKALLVFEGFNNTIIHSIEKNGQTWYRLTIVSIKSRSRMNRVRDFLGKHELDSVYTRIK